MSEQLALLPGYLTAHLQLALVALAAGAGLAIPAGVAATRRPRLGAPVLGVASVVQTIPSLALLAIMVPALAGAGAFTARTLGVELRSIGFLPAVLALTLYGLLPMLRNTVAGIEGIDPALVEAARGVGMTERQALWRVQLPLALPVIVAGLRTAAVWVVGTATLSTPVGAPSLGNYIFSGLQTRNTTAVLVGCVAAAALALALDQTIRLLEVGVRLRRRAALAIGAALLVGLYAWAALGFGAQLRGTAARPVRIGAKTFTEQYILSELLALAVRRETGRVCEVVGSLGSTVAFDALRAGELDAYVDYSGTLWANVLRREGFGAGREAVLAEVERALREQHGVGVAAALGFENAYAFAMRAARARALGVRTLGDLARVGPALEVGGDIEFFQRPEWTEIQKRYGLAFRRVRSMDASLMYQAVANGQVDVITAFSSDGRIAAHHLVLLEDELGVIPPYDALVLVSRRLQAEEPDALAALRALGGVLDEAAMQRLNLAVDRDGRAPAEVAREFLDGLTARTPRANARRP
jgi:osmoprotectant transport system permease protein